MKKYFLIPLLIILLIILLMWYGNGTKSAINNCVENGYSYDFCVSGV